MALNAKKAFVDECWYEYSEEFVTNLREKEARRIPFKYQAPQFEYRCGLVTWLRFIAQDHNLERTTVHLAVYLLDNFMDNHDIDEGQLHLVALVCILLAAKMEERPNAPLISELNAHVGNQYSVQQFKSMEVMIMEFFKWNLMIPTAVDFAEHFTNFAISTFDVLTVPLELNRHPELRNAVYSYTQCFLDLSLLEVCLLDVKPSLVAAACIAAARQAVRLSSRWPTALENATTYQYEDLEPFVMLLMRRANIKVARGNKRKSTESSDDGYESDDSFTNNLEDSNGQRSSKRSRTCSSSNAVFLHS